MLSSSVLKQSAEKLDSHCPLVPDLLHNMHTEEDFNLNVKNTGQKLHPAAKYSLLDIRGSGGSILTTAVSITL